MSSGFLRFPAVLPKQWLSNGFAGSGLDETFACSALQELLWLRRAAGSGGGSREGPLLAPLAPLELPQASGAGFVPWVWQVVWPVGGLVLELVREMEAPGKSRQ